MSKWPIKKFNFAAAVLVIALLAVSCQPAPEQTAVPSNGMVFSGEMEGSAFEIANGDIDETMMELIEAFNRMDAEALWAHSADTITFHGSDGSVGPMTQADMAGFMAGMDSLSWDPTAIIPVRATGSSRVQVLVEGYESMYPKEGPARRIKLFERFSFEDGLLVEVRQWAAAEPAGDS